MVELKTKITDKLLNCGWTKITDKLLNGGWIKN
jgi:hypothetical protein